MDAADLRERLPALDRDDIAVDGLYAAALVAVTAFALWIRLIPRDGMRYLQALDPYAIARMAEAMVTEGHLPMLDMWRFFPYGTPTYLMNLGDIAIPAYLYTIVAPFGIGFTEWTQVYPAAAGAGMIVAMYFIGKELFDRRAGIFAAFFLAASPAVLHRSSAGWFEKEPIAALLMFVSIYFFARAWKRESWPSGILSGAALGIAMTSWGGARFLILLYPAVVFPVAFIDEDIRGLIAAYTPAVILGHFVPAIFNTYRWSVPNATFVFGLGLAGMLWIRYLAGDRGYVTERQGRYLVPGMTFAGGVLALLAPLYSQTLARYVNAAIGLVSQDPGSVVGGTVAENTPATAPQIIGQLGAFRAGRVIPALAPVTEFYSGWTFALVGTAILLTIVVGMLVRRFAGVEYVRSRVAYLAVLPSFALLAGLLWAGIPGTTGGAFLFAVFVLVAGGSLLVMFPVEGNRVIPRHWHYVLPLVWILATLWGATQRSRILFLTAHPVALMAGVAVSFGIREFRRSGLMEMAEGALQDRDLPVDMTAQRIARLVVIVALFVPLVLAPIVLVNSAAAYSMANGVGGSPNQLWMENLEFMREETPADSVVLSWWDYGYWFQTIGGRAAIADGGNLNFFNSAPGFEYHAINMPLADFLASEDTEAWMPWLRNYSVDYVVLDSSMIGKYSAVSQIHNRDNDQFNAMQTARCRSQNGRCVTTTAENQTYLVYESRGTRFLVPFAQDGQSLRIDGPATIQTQRGTARIPNACTEQGVEEFDLPRNASRVPGCVSFHPYRGYQTLVYVPAEIMDTTLVRLYVMDAHDMPRFDEVFDNGYVKMWKVDYGG